MMPHMYCGKEDWVWQICGCLYLKWACGQILSTEGPEDTLFMDVQGPQFT